jgi:hypothetical protein
MPQESALPESDVIGSSDVIGPRQDVLYGVE